MKYIFEKNSNVAHTPEEFIQKYEKNKEEISEDDLTAMLGLDDFSMIYTYADNIRKENFKDIVDIRAILEFSNYCKRLCKYCGLNRKNKSLVRYRMDVDEIVETVKEASLAGYKTIVLQSGEDPFYTVDILCNIIRKIKEVSDIFITISCGERELSDYEQISQSGADRYLLKHETADNELYTSLHPCNTLENRIKCLKKIKQSGLETGSGFMIGLPNQELSTIAKDILLLKKLDCDMAGIGPFIPSPNTELKDCKAGSTELTKRAVALTRLILPKANLPATTSLGVLDANEKNSIFSCGANVIMRKVTPQKYEQYYSIYPNEIKVDNIKKERQDLENFIKSLGRIPR